LAPPAWPRARVRLGPMSEAEGPKTTLIGCSLCGAILSAFEGDLTLASHTVAAQVDEATCPGSGDEGIALGSKAHYRFRHGALVLIGGSRMATVRIQCPRCQEEFRIPEPPEGAFSRKLRVEVDCRHCGTDFYLASLREGPDGLWARRTGIG